MTVRQQTILWALLILGCLIVITIAAGHTAGWW